MGFDLTKITRDENGCISIRVFLAIAREEGYNEAYITKSLNRHSPDVKKVITLIYENTVIQYKLTEGKKVEFFEGKKGHKYFHFDTEGKKIKSGKNLLGN